MKNKHIYSSASSAHRWLNCTKSTELVKLVPEPEQSIYAEEGTKAHEELAAIVNRYINNDDKLTLTDIRPEWRVFLDHLDFWGVRQIFVEHAVQYNGIKGTLDFSWITGRTLHIRDLKWGEGQVVEAINNAQMALYAIATMDGFNSFQRELIDEVVVGIYQPRKTLEENESPFSYWSLDAKSLEEWEAKFNEAVNQITSRQLQYKTGPWCSWCPAHPICPEFRKKYEGALEIKSGGLPDLSSLSVSQVEQIALHGKDVIKWIEAVQGLAYRYATNGMTFENLKLVAGTPRRHWKDDENKVAEELILIGVKEPWNKKLKGLTEVEKEIGKGKLENLTTKSEPKPSLVPINDRRQAITMETPEDVFDDI